MQRFYSRDDWHAAKPQPTMSQTLNSVTEVFIHHSDDTNAEVVNSLPVQKTAMQRTQQFHMKTRGWSDIAYHFVVFQEYGSIPLARVFAGRALSAVPAAQLDHNVGTLAICVYGNFETDLVKPSTRFAIEETINHARKLGMHNLHKLGGHRDVVATSCPGKNLYSQLPRIAQVINLQLYK